MLILAFTQTSCSSPASGVTPAVHALFDLARAEGGPFPSDRFTVADSDQLSGRRVNLPKPNCAERPSDCEDIDVLNALDGFNMQPRLSIPFSGAIEVKSITSKTVFLICLGDTLKADEGNHEDKVIGINQIVWDPVTHTLLVRSDESLDQHTRYALIVTRGVRDESGAAVEASEPFRRFRKLVRGPYEQALHEGIQAARQLGVREADVAVASVFTTQTFSHIIERMREAIQKAPAPRVVFGVGTGGARGVPCGRDRDADEQR